MSQQPLADWRLAERLGWAVGSSGLPEVTASDVAGLRADLGATVARADAVAREVTGLGAGLDPAGARVIGRRAWIRDNLAAMAHLTDPVADRLVRTSGLARSVARRGLAVQLGVVFGYLSTKVLGQYEVFHPEAEVEGRPGPGRLTLVGPNLVELERTVLPGSGLGPTELRMGLCLHEVAHRLQFEAVPWLRPRLRAIVDGYLSEARLEPEQVREAAGAARRLLAEPSRLTDRESLLAVVLTPTQRRLFDEAQSLMSLLEGHGNVVMDWGAEVIAARDGLDVDPARVRSVLNRRRQQATDQALRKLLGLGLKAQQYRLGERFIFAVAERHGREAFARVWEDPANVPSRDELDDPDAWVARVAGGRG
ncbi:MAG: zinc-dependent metalloprotease [Egibacteraceae bacterium]